MPLFAIVVDNKPEVYKVIKETNKRLKGSGYNPAIIFLSGKISAYKELHKKLILFCNIRPLLWIPLFKRLFKFVMTKALKKKGYKGEKPVFLSNKKMLEHLEGMI